LTVATTITIEWIIVQRWK